MKKVSILLILILLSTGSVFSCAWAGAGTEEAAVSAAKAWLSLIDKGRYVESWLKASAYFQGAVSQDSWKASLDGVRKPLGGLVSRRVKTARSLTELPGAPDGLYVVMEFVTSFMNKKSAVETVTFMLEKDGKWKAAGYFIR
jgi:hypothetical protein